MTSATDYFGLLLFFTYFVCRRRCHLLVLLMMPVSLSPFALRVVPRPNIPPTVPPTFAPRTPNRGPVASYILFSPLSASRNSMDSWNSSNYDFEDPNAVWKEDQIRLLSRYQLFFAQMDTVHIERHRKQGRGCTLTERTSTSTHADVYLRAISPTPPTRSPSAPTGTKIHTRIRYPGVYPIQPNALRFDY
ncbi:hypothetical protein L210DRAFT_3537789 [Boletus edulis BED1]|uniref:Uncharacterized protein n=1 Tax=Boletus edulis BED1 TaxID=1328754 RepID=A0AAD4GGS7_BOLED|nr:hypothetical protein L210DRAFT_3537789 [Boletus edulis BED1]